MSHPLLLPKGAKGKKGIGGFCCLARTSRFVFVRMSMKDYWLGRINRRLCYQPISKISYLLIFIGGKAN